ncbi:MAG: Rpn family recombination-promoting nuclease/putative transposase [Proteobacteria bacterium]|nr:Rpn family recombination-promoting nuclease/putative transposase [Pseudomonadota bacterium]
MTTAKHLTTLRSEKGTDLGVAYSALPSREPFSDLLYAVPLDGRQAFIYLLLEHQSSAP